MNISPGLLIRDYKVSSCLGKGGMGEVWLAEDIQIQRLVALKLLYPAIAVDQAFVERFRLEAKIQANLHHVNILGIHSFFPYERTHVLCMEYAAGLTLRDLIAQIGLLPVDRAVLILRQCLDVLDFIHSRKIIHRDIKPSNIMVDTARDDLVKVMDFGVAKGPDSGQLTKVGTTIGSPFYMSPEQVCNSGIDHRSDIFSLGVTFYEMLTGRQPFSSETGSEYTIGKQIVEQALPDPREHYPFIADWIVELINKMCHKDRERRFQSAREILNDIDYHSKPGAYQTSRSNAPIKEPDPEPEISSTATEKTFYIPEDDLMPRSRPRAWLITILILIIIGVGIILIKPHKTIIGRDSKVIAADNDLDSSTMVKVPSGGFNMGHPTSVLTDERPVHWVELKSFLIGIHEVTLGEYMEIMDNNPMRDGDVKLPVRNVNWYEAIEYCNRLSVKRGLNPCYTTGSSGIDGVTCDFTSNGYRLPTEAEWEFAAREGKRDLVYNHSGSSSLDEVGWYLSNTSIDPYAVDYYDLSPSPVGLKKPNELGIYDMSGNVWEWVWDRYDKKYYYYSPSDNPKGPEDGNNRVLRGGAFDSERGFCYVSTRGVREPEVIHRSYGFRICRNAP